jgi:hypothetical protein
VRRLAYPPPTSKVRPRYYTIDRESELFRIYDPSPPYNTGPTSFRHYCPRHRFDHQRRVRGKAAEDPIRGIWYGGFQPAASIVETFGDDREIRLKPYHAAIIKVLRPLKLLDLDDGAMANGTYTALSSARTRRLTQAWGKYFYEAESVYGRVDGLYYRGAHNAGLCVALYERSVDAILCVRTMPLDDPSLVFEIADAQRRYGLTLFTA